MAKEDEGEEGDARAGATEVPRSMASILAWVVLVGVPAGVLVVHGAVGFNLEDFAHLGDALASVALLLAGVAVWLQSRELSLQRAELRLQRDQLERIAEANRDQLSAEHKRDLRKAYGDWYALLVDSLDAVVGKAHSRDSEVATILEWNRAYRPLRSAVAVIALVERDETRRLQAVRLSAPPPAKLEVPPHHYNLAIRDWAIQRRNDLDGFFDSLRRALVGSEIELPATEPPAA